MQKITRLVSRPERISRQKAEDARQAVLDLELPKTATETMLVAIARHTFPATPERWTFHMLQPKQVLTVWAIRAFRERTDLTRSGTSSTSHSPTSSGTQAL